MFFFAVLSCCLGDHHNRFLIYWYAIANCAGTHCLVTVLQCRTFITIHHCLNISGIFILIKQCNQWQLCYAKYNHTYHDEQSHTEPSKTTYSVMHRFIMAMFIAFIMIAQNLQYLYLLKLWSESLAVTWQKVSHTIDGCFPGGWHLTSYSVSLLNVYDSPGDIYNVSQCCCPIQCIYLHASWHQLWLNHTEMESDTELSTVLLHWTVFI